MKKLLTKIARFFQGGKAEQVFSQVESLVEKAAPIVAAIAAMTPNRTVQEIAGAFESYGVPLVRSIDATPPAERGYLLLDLATKVMAREHPLATNILQSAVQLAVTGLKAK